LFYTDHRFAENYQIYSSEILSSRQLVWIKLCGPRLHLPRFHMPRIHTHSDTVCLKCFISFVTAVTSRSCSDQTKDVQANASLFSGIIRSIF
jgi:hypothetical protein